MEQEIVNVQQLNRLVLQKNSQYILLVEGQLADSVNEEGLLELEILYQGDQDTHESLLITQYELNDQHEYIDRYIPNQYGLIFTDKLFLQQLHSDSLLGLNASLVFTLKKTLIKEIKEIKDNKLPNKTNNKN